MLKKTVDSIAFEVDDDLCAFPVFDLMCGSKFQEGPLRRVTLLVVGVKSNRAQQRSKGHWTNARGGVSSSHLVLVRP